jgi:hypothetical protein
VSPLALLDTLDSPLGVIEPEHFIALPNSSSARASVTCDFVGGEPERIYLIRESDALALHDYLTHMKVAA